MRALLVLFGLGATASAAVALHEVRHEAVHRDQISRPQPTTSPHEDLVHAPRAELTFPRGPLPFGGVPGEPTDAPPRITLNGDIPEANVDITGEIADVPDRCPNDLDNDNVYEDNDGCPDRVVTMTIDIPPAARNYATIIN